jgi:hypothetical protein
MNNEAEIRLVYGREFVVWRNSTGFAERDGRPLRFGLCPGSSDLIGIADGLFLAVECKLRSGRLSAEQIRFLQLVYDRGGIACACRSKEMAEEQIVRIRAGERRLGW